MKKYVHLFCLYFQLCSAMLFSSCSGNGTEGGKIGSIADLDGRSVAVLSGSVQDLLISEECPNSIILRSDSMTDTYTMVDKGKVCALVTSSISWAMAKYDFPDVVEVCGDISPMPIGFCLSKSSQDLKGRLDAFLKDYLENTDLEAVNSDWADPNSTREMPRPDEVIDPVGTLRIATCAIFPPYDFIRNGEVVGCEAEILARFAISENMRWEFMDVAFAGLINCIQSGKADIGSSIISITPERQHSVDFSIPWTSETSVLIVNKAYAPGGLAIDGVSGSVNLWQSIKDNVDKSLVKEKRYMLLLDGLKTTVIISLLAALFGTFLGMGLCYTSMHKNKLLAKTSNIFVEFLRGMPQVVFLMIMFYVVFGKSDIDGVWVAIIAFSLCFAAYTSVIFRSAVLSIDKGQKEAAFSMGFGKVRAFINVILPQAVQRALPVYKGEFIGLVKATSIVGYIAVFDVTKAGDVIRSRTYDAFFPLIMVTILYFLVIWALTALLKFIEARTQPKRKKFFK